jgi:hypothetical protein
VIEMVEPDIADVLKGIIGKGG